MRPVSDKEIAQLKRCVTDEPQSTRRIWRKFGKYSYNTVHKYLEEMYANGEIIRKKFSKDIYWSRK